jgi:hypothetical protein
VADNDHNDGDDEPNPEEIGVAVSGTIKVPSGCCSGIDHCKSPSRFEAAAPRFGVL